MIASKDQIYCILDYETYSEADLKKVGAFEYSMHPSTEIICAAWRIGTREQLKTAKTKILDGASDHTELFLIFANPRVKLVAHNAFFEHIITYNTLGRKSAGFPVVNSERWICTASLAAALALPRNLEGAAKALNLTAQKDMEGNRLIKKWCKPRKPTKNNPKTRHDNPAELARIVEYCKQDVDTEVELFLKLPMLTPTEREVWLLDQKINLRGFAVDRPLVDKVLGMIDEETKIINQKTEDLTFGILRSATQREGVMKCLDGLGIDMPDLTKKTVEAFLKREDLCDISRNILEHRAAISKTSTAKYQAFEMRSRHDGRVRDILLYHAASTGRWGGVGVQPQNLPKASIKDTDQAAQILKTEDLETVRLIYGDPMSVFSSCVRSVIIAPRGKILDVADYNAIETRILFWIAKHEDGVKAFKEGRDLYREQASKVFNKPVDKIDTDSFERFVGKGLILGCGYNMGAKKFAESCANQGQEISQDLAEAAVKSYRTTHAPVVKLWDNIHRAAIWAVNNLGRRCTINYTKWFVENDFLFCELPSGRRLAYHRPQIVYEPTPWGEKRPVLYHNETNPLTRQWGLTKTYGGKLVENVVQAIARDLMAEAMLRIEATGKWQIVLSVHDELIAERDDLSSTLTNGDFCALMAELPSWAEGCPIAVKGWSGYRYKK